MSFTPMFKAGDKLVCIDDEDTLLLKLGNIYTASKNSYIGHIGLEFVSLDEIDRDGMFVERFKLKEDTEPKTISPFFGKKYRVTPETSELLQMEVFKAGGKWCSGSTYVLYPNSELIYVDAEGYLGVETFGAFDKHPSPEATLEVVKSVVIKDVIPAKTEKDLKLEELQKAMDKHKESMAELQQQIDNLKGE
jgi:hypothetical protein